jgi:hypothetical protein
VVGLFLIPQGLATFGSLVGQNSGGAIDDVSATRRIQIIIAVLASAGVLLAALTVWLWRSTKPTLEVLGPLEVMGKKRFWRSDSNSRQRALDAARPDGASATPEAKPPPVDLAALAASRSLPSMDDHAGFGDLVDASIPMEQGGSGAAGVTHGPARTAPTPPPPSASPSLNVPPVPVVFDQADFTDMVPRPESFETIPSIEAEPNAVVELPSNLRQLPFRPFGRSSTDASPSDGARRPSFPPPTRQDLIDAEMEPIDIPDSE